MEIVPTSSPEKREKEISLDALLIRKAELKSQINDQKRQITVSTQNLFTPATFTNYIFRAFTKSLSVVDGVMLGFKIIKSIRGIFKKR